jgi:MFS family permease
MALPNLSELPAPAEAPTVQRVGPLKLFSPELRRPTILVWLSFFAVMFGFYFVMSWTPKLLAASGLTAAQGVTGGVLLSLGGIFGTALLGLLAARFRLNYVLAVFMVTTAVLLCFIVSNPGSLLASFSLAFLIGVVVNGCVAGLYAIASVVYDASVRATGMGWGIGIGRFGAIVSPLIAGALIDAAWKPAQLYVGYGVAFLIAAVIVLLHRLEPPTDTRDSGTLQASAAH